ncbi:MAG: ComEC/Rec2 family competence protein [Planctomycetota bacterium]|jgi:competence protein ComEC
MPANADGRLHVYVLNVGQADASVVVCPDGEVMVIDAVKPDKLTRLLRDLGLPDGDTIEHLLITHPHSDHYTGAQRLLRDYDVSAVTLAPFWHYAGTPGYHTIINLVEADDIPVRFVSGYERVYPQGGAAPGGAAPVYLELLGPPNRIMADLDAAGKLNPNHLSVISRLTWGQFSMVSAGDAQMENWAHFDSEGMLGNPCDVLKAAHHGSCRGTQFERLERLSPRLVLVSSDPSYGHNLPDLIGCATFLKSNDSRIVALTRDTGTVEISTDVSGRFDARFFGDGRTGHVNRAHPTTLNRANNPTDWAALTSQRANAAVGP